MLDDTRPNVSDLVEMLRWIEKGNVSCTTEKKHIRDSDLCLWDLMTRRERKTSLFLVSSDSRGTRHQE